jgi:hypothetical protein
MPAVEGPAKERHDSVEHALGVARGDIEDAALADGGKGERECKLEHRQHSRGLQRGACAPCGWLENATAEHPKRAYDACHVAADGEMGSDVKEPVRTLAAEETSVQEDGKEAEGLAQSEGGGERREQRIGAAARLIGRMFAKSGRGQRKVLHICRGNARGIPEPDSVGTIACAP